MFFQDQIANNSITMARAVISIEPHILDKILNGQDEELNQLIDEAQQAGIKAAKKTQESIPASKPLSEDTVKIGLIGAADDTLEVQSTITTRTERKSAKMEALSAASIAAFTLQSLCQEQGRQAKVKTIEVVD